ncbi:MAG: tetratricopeptide repeat protein, partial [Prevotellaceae bacterium]|nr:tetratricopeptide repeat protein [Prevotellaceae bacterium]
KPPAKTDTIGTNINYHLVFDASKGREANGLTIHVDGFSPLTMNWFLHPRQQLNYHLFDPDSTLVRCDIQLMREGLNLFQSGIYEDARKKYEMAKECPIAENHTEIDKRLAIIDSVMLWRRQADAHLARSNYAEAIKYCQKILEKNPNDGYNANNLEKAKGEQKNFCTFTLKMAKSYFDEKDFEQAELLYKKIIENSCNESSLAFAGIKEIENKRKLPHVLTYEYARDVPIGISTGKYKNRKTGGYFTLRLNSDVFELLRTDGDEKLRPELNISFGWTIKIVNPVWIFFGPGYTGTGKYLADGVVENESENVKLKLNLYHAISPEAGLLGKIRLSNKIGIALRYTFQYRYALDKNATDYIGQMRHVFGVGLCF